ncbi:MAG: hypothetical protein HY075_10900 [Deltaproteobacteria bacterium]|nr:hypothetical protein [Deltaproteobacteria bacterium]
MMNPRILASVVLAASLCASLASAATPLGPFDRRAEDDKTVVAHKEIGLKIKHDKQLKFKLKTAQLPAHVVARIKKNTLASKKGGK